MFEESILDVLRDGSEVVPEDVATLLITLNENRIRELKSLRDFQYHWRQAEEKSQVDERNIQEFKAVNDSLKTAVKGLNLQLENCRNKFNFLSEEYKKLRAECNELKLEMEQTRKRKTKRLKAGK